MSLNYHIPLSKVYQNDYIGPEVNRSNGIALQTFSILTMILALVPLTSLIRIQQVGPCSLILISMIFSGFTVVNSSIWDNDDHAKWYNGTGICHFQTPLRQPLTIAFSFAMVLMPWKLIETLRTRKVHQKNQIWRELVFVWGIPLFLVFPFQYLVMSNVYSIMPGFGCLPEFDETWLGFFIVYIWWVILPPLTFILSCIMCVMIHRKREEIINSLHDKSSSYAQRPFIKLYVLAIMIVFIYLPVQLTFIAKFVPVHYQTKNIFALINSKHWNIPAFYHTSDDPQIQYQPWAYISINFLMFCFYGASDEARRLYCQILNRIGLGTCFSNLEAPGSRRSTVSGSSGNSASSGRSGRSGGSTSGLLSHAGLIAYVTRKLDGHRKQDEFEKDLE